MPIGTGFLSGTAAVMLGGILVVGAAVYDAGAVRVSVDEKKVDGTHLHLIVPAAVVPVGLNLVPDRYFREASKEIQPWISVIKVATEELEKYPDLTLVEVDDMTDHVKITKQGHRLVIDVNTVDETVHVAVPFKTIRSAVRRMETMSPWA